MLIIFKFSPVLPLYEAGYVHMALILAIYSEEGALQFMHFSLF